MRLPVVMVAAVVAVGSAGSAGAQDTSGDAPDSSIADGSAQVALDAARARWKHAALRSYGEEIRLTCFCPEFGFVRVLVGGGVPSRRTPTHLRDVATVPRQFRVVQEAIDARYAELTVRYGPRGQPTVIALDPGDVAFPSDNDLRYAFRRLTRR